MIPACIDHQQILQDLNAWGLRDFKIEMICGFSVGYVSQLKCGNVEEMGYRKAARLYNFWYEEQRARLPIHTVIVTTGAA